MKKIFTFVILALVGLNIVDAEPISRTKAASIASKYMYGLSKKAKKMVLREPSVQEQLDVNEAAPYYLFNAADGCGFVIVAGDDLLPEIAGYSSKGSVADEDMSDGLMFYLNCYRKYVDYVRRGEITVTRKAQGVGTPIVDYLVKTAWNQTYPYNKYAPEIADVWNIKYNNRYPIGCVALSTAQVLNYWQWPVAPQAKGDVFYAQHTLFDKDKELGLCKDTLDLSKLPAYEYDWANMTDKYLTYNNAEGVENYEAKAEAVGILLRDIAYALSMDWGRHGGGCLEDLGVLVRNFGYAADCTSLQARHYDGDCGGEQWMSIVKSNLDKGQPLIYGGYSSSGGGHSFVLDGYDSDDKVHINWGWGGMDNGWFDITCLNSSIYDEKPSGDYDFSFNCTMINNLHPNKTGEDQVPAPSNVAFLLMGTNIKMIDPFGNNAVRNAYLDENSIITNSYYKTGIATSFCSDMWKMGLDLDYDYVIANEEEKEVLRTGTKNLMHNGITTITGLARQDISDTLFLDMNSLPDGKYIIRNEAVVHNENGDRSEPFYPLGFQAMPNGPIYMEKTDGQYFFSLKENDFNKLYNASKQDERDTYWITIYAQESLENITDSLNLSITVDISMPEISGTAKKDFDMSSEKYKKGTITITDKATSNVLQTEEVDLSAIWITLAMLDEDDEDDQSGYDCCETKVFKTLFPGSYTLTIDIPLLKANINRDFTIGYTTDIATTKVAENVTGTRYNIAGQRVADSYKGIVIRNGKKVIK